MKSISGITSLLALALLIGCGDAAQNEQTDQEPNSTQPINNPNQPDPKTKTENEPQPTSTFGGKLVKAEGVERAAPDAEPELVAAYTLGQTDLGLRFMRAAIPASENGTISAYSLSDAIAIAVEGFELLPEVKEEGKAALGHLQGIEQHEAANTVVQGLNKIDDAPGTILRVVNDLWLEDPKDVSPDYLDFMAIYYGNGYRQVPLASNPGEGTQEINGYIKDFTAGLIPELIPAGAITPDTDYVITNVIYLNAPWKVPFRKPDTKPRDFTLDDGTVTQANAMVAEADVRLWEEDDVTFVGIPYTHDDLEFQVIMPKAGTFQQYREQVTAQDIRDLSDAAYFELADLQFPKFEVRSAPPVIETLLALGLPAEFFGPITEILHEAVVIIDEERTEAAAATAVIVQGENNVEVPWPVPVIIDRPFLFSIVQRSTGVTLFQGQYVAP